MSKYLLKKKKEQLKCWGVLETKSDGQFSLIIFYFFVVFFIIKSDIFAIRMMTTPSFIQNTWQVTKKKEKFYISI